MRTRTLQIAIMVLFSGLCLRAQETPVPKGEVFATYSYFNIDGGDLIGYRLGLAAHVQLGDRSTYNFVL